VKPNPLQTLETMWQDDVHLRREVGFCARWSLDNLCKYHKIMNLNKEMLYLIVEKLLCFHFAYRRPFKRLG